MQTCYPAAAVRPTKSKRVKLTRDDVERVLAGEVKVRRRFVATLLPVVHVRVARGILRRRNPGGGASQRSLIEDYSQDVFEYLFQNDARALRRWDSERGMSLENYVGMIAEQRVAAALRTRSRNPWTEAPTCAEHLDAVTPPQNAPDRDVVARQLLQRLIAEMEEQLSPRGREIFRRLVLDNQPVAVISDELGMSTSAVHAWSSRLRKRLRKTMQSLSELPTSKQEPS